MAGYLAYLFPPTATPTPATGLTQYDAEPEDGTYASAPAVAEPATYTPSFRAKSLTVLVDVSSVDVRLSADEGETFGAWLPLAPGVHAFDIETDEVEVRNTVDANGAKYRIVAFA